MILRRVLFFIDLGPLGLYKEIYKARAYTRNSCTSCATENTDYLTKCAKQSLLESQPANIFPKKRLL
jgi:hypothetical protein